MVETKRSGRENGNSIAAGFEVRPTQRGGGGAGGGGEIQPIDLAGKSFCIFGLKGSGKSTLTRHIASLHHAVIFDIHGEYSPTKFWRWVPKNKVFGDELLKEFELACNEFIFSKNYNFEMLLIDEANQYFPNQKPLPPAAGQINDFNRHWKLAVGYIARRPQQLNTDLVSLADHLFIFTLKGKTERKYWNDYHEGLGDVIFNLKPHHFVSYNLKETAWEICAPIDFKNKREVAGEQNPATPE